MTRRRDCLLLLAAAPWAVPAPGATDALALLRSRLDAAPLLRGQFSQTRRLKGFRHPLQSSGDFVVARGRGVLWLTRKPFVSTTIVTPERMETLNAQGERTALLDAAAEPALRAVNTMLLAALAGDPAPLRSMFELQAEAVGDAGWRLEATPTAQAQAAPFARIVLSGERQLRAIRLEERNGDATEIGFTGVQAAAAPTAAEDALLAGRGQ